MKNRKRSTGKGNRKSGECVWCVAERGGGAAFIGGDCDKHREGNMGERIMIGNIVRQEEGNQPDECLFCELERPEFWHELLDKWKAGTQRCGKHLGPPERGRIRVWGGG